MPSSPKELLPSTQEQVLRFAMGGLIFGGIMGAIYSLGGSLTGLYGGLAAGAIFGIAIGIATTSLLKSLPEVPPLTQGEQCLIRVPANYLGKGGALYATNKGVHFLSHRYNGQQGSNLQLFIPYSEMTHASRLRISITSKDFFTGGLAPRLGIHTKKGESWPFNVYRIDAWVEYLNHQ